MSSVLEVAGHTIKITGTDVECESDEFELFFDNRSHKTLHVDPERDASFELMSCQKDRSNSLFMDHLYVPDKYKGEGFGKLGMAFFYHILQDEGYSKFSIKFGGGGSSAGFLGGVGFNSSDIYTKKDVEYNGQSVMVGDLTETGSRSYDWSLQPISKSRFPTGFFSLS